MPRRLIELTAEEFGLLPRATTVFFVATAPLEDFGPHLPLGLGITHAEALASRLAERVEKDLPGWVGVLLPSAPLGIDSHTRRLALTTRGYVLRDWLVDTFSPLAREEFLHFVCVSGSLGPRQLTAIEEAGKILRRRTGGPWGIRGWFGRRNIPDLVSASSALVAPGEVARSPLWLDAPEHGGAQDTSLLLAIAPEQVRPTYLSLPPREKIGSRSARFWNWFTRELTGYWGTPASANAPLGLRQLNDEIDQIYPKLRIVWEGKSSKWLFRSWYSILPPNQSFFKAWLLSVILAIMLLVWFVISFERILTV